MLPLTRCLPGIEGLGIGVRALGLVSMCLRRFRAGGISVPYTLRKGSAPPPHPHCLVSIWVTRSFICFYFSSYEVLAGAGVIKDQELRGAGVDCSRGVR